MLGFKHVRWLVVAVVGLALTGGVVPTVLASSPASAAGASISVSPSSAPAGTTVSFSGVVPTSGTPSCSPGPVTLTSVAALFPPDGFGPQASRNASGAFQVNFLVRATTPPGTYSIGVRCGGGNVGISTTLKVTSGQQGNSLSVSPSTTRAGGTVVFSGVVPSGCQQFSPVTLTDSSSLFPPDGFGPQASRNASGAFQVHFTVPSSTPPGTYVVGGRCGGGNIGVSTSLRVTSAPVGTAAPAQPVTGTAPFTG